MSRLRYNGLSTTLGGSGLTNVATSVTFAAALTHSNGTNVPTIVSPDYIPLAILGATGHLSEIVYLTAYTAGTTTGTITRGQEGTAGAAHSSGDAVTQAPLVADMSDTYLSPGGNTYETINRAGLTATVSGVSGTLRLTAISLPSGLSVGHIGVVSGLTGATTPTHWWFGLFDSNRVALAFTADQTTTAWAASTAKFLSIATVASGAASSFTTTYTGLHYIGFMVTAATPPDCPCVSSAVGGAVTGIVPITSGSSNTGQTTVPAFPFTASAITAIQQTSYAYVGA